MNRIPLDFAKRVVNLLSYDDSFKTYNYNYRKHHEKDRREQHAPALSRLSRPWSQVIAAQPQECHVCVDEDDYSIHTMVNCETESGFPGSRLISKVDIMTWDRRTHVVTELNFHGRRLRNILRGNQRPISIRYQSRHWYFLSPKCEENVDKLLPAIHGIGLLDVSCGFITFLPRLLEKPVNFFSMASPKCEENVDKLLPAIQGVGLLHVTYGFMTFLPRLLAKPVNFFNMTKFLSEELESAMEQSIEAMKKGLLRGWQYLRHEPTDPRNVYNKTVSAVLDLHSERPPVSFWYAKEWLSDDSAKRFSDLMKK
uniref:RNA-directed DNA polymerase from mobile element jockey n=1 Tax=Steinernema glaseri TaxID=37863 RepID=A0A1I7XZX3_9BILA